MKIETRGRDWRLYSWHEIDDSFDDNIDLFLEWNGQVFSFTVFTVKNISTLMARWESSGEQAVPYFWAENAVIVPELSERALHDLVDDLIEKKEVGIALGELIPLSD